MNSLLRKDHRGEFVLAILFAVFLVMRFQLPSSLAYLIDNIVGKAVLFVGVLYLFMRCNPILAVLGLFVAFELIRQSSRVTGIDDLARYAPSEVKKMSQFSAMNQFPYTLEQEVVAKMAPIVQSASYIGSASYKPNMDSLHGAVPVNRSD